MDRSKKHNEPHTHLSDRRRGEYGDGMPEIVMAT